MVELRPNILVISIGSFSIKNIFKLAHKTAPNFILDTKNGGKTK